MRRPLAITGQCSVVIILAIMCLISSGCGDSASISTGPEVRLANLTINPGSLQPAFSSDTVNYEANVPSTVDAVTVTATPQDSTATVTIAGTAPEPSGYTRSTAIEPSHHHPIDVAEREPEYLHHHRQ